MKKYVIVASVLLVSAVLFVGIAAAVPSPIEGDDYTLEDGVLTFISDKGFLYANGCSVSGIVKIVVGPDVSLVVFGGGGQFTDLQEYEVDSSNTNFTASDGILFNYDKTTLVAYPAKKTGESYVVPSTVTKLEASAFANNEYLKYLTISDTVTTIMSSYAMGYKGTFYGTSLKALYIGSNVGKTAYNHMIFGLSSGAPLTTLEKVVVHPDSELEDSDLTLFTESGSATLVRGTSIDVDVKGTEITYSQSEKPYVLKIPASFEFDSLSDPKMDTVNLTDVWTDFGYAVQVNISSVNFNNGFNLKLDGTSHLHPYSVKCGASPITQNNVAVLTVNGGASGHTGEQDLTFAMISTPQYTGTYKDTLTFTAKVVAVTT